MDTKKLKRKASPAARKLARDLGVDIEAILPDEPGKVILMSDVLEAQAQAEGKAKPRSTFSPIENLGSIIINKHETPLFDENYVEDETVFQDLLEKVEQKSRDGDSSNPFSVFDLDQNPEPQSDVENEPQTEALEPAESSFADDSEDSETSDILPDVPAWDSDDNMDASQADSSFDIPSYNASPADLSEIGPSEPSAPLSGFDDSKEAEDEMIMSLLSSIRSPQSKLESEPETTQPQPSVSIPSNMPPPIPSFTENGPEDSGEEESDIEDPFLSMMSSIPPQDDRQGSYFDMFNEQDDEVPLPKTVPAPEPGIEPPVSDNLPRVNMPFPVQTLVTANASPPAISNNNQERRPRMTNSEYDTYQDDEDAAVKVITSSIKVADISVINLITQLGLNNAKGVVKTILKAIAQALDFVRVDYFDEILIVDASENFTAFMVKNVREVPVEGMDYERAPRTAVADAEISIWDLSLSGLESFSYSHVNGMNIYLYHNNGIIRLDMVNREEIMDSVNSIKFMSKLKSILENPIKYI